MNTDHGGVFYLLPGGGQENGETLHAALREGLAALGDPHLGDVN